MAELEPILHVEDDALVARAVSRLCKDRGFLLNTVRTCAQARQVPDAYRVGVFDIDLPDGDGITLAEELRRRGVVRQVFFYTGNLEPRSVARALRVGRVITKSDGGLPLLAEIGLPHTHSEYPAPSSEVTGPGVTGLEVAGLEVTGLEVTGLEEGEDEKRFGAG